MSTFPASIVTPERVLLEREVSAVILRTDLGDATFLADHTPLIGDIVPGVTRLAQEDGTEEHVAVHGGFVQVEGTRVVVLAPVAELAEDIDVDRARRSLDVARSRLAELGSQRGSEADDERARTEAEAAVRRAEVRLEVAGAS